MVVVVFTPAVLQEHLWKMKMSPHWGCGCTGAVAVAAADVAGRKKSLFLQHSSSSAHSPISSKTPKAASL